MTLHILALVTDAFGGHGGIAQYNRALLSSLSRCEGVGEVLVLPRAGVACSPKEHPESLRQFSPVSGRFAYSLAALRAARKLPSVDIVFCGHVFMAPLAALIARRFDARLWVQVHGIDAWEELAWPCRLAIEMADLITSVSRHTRRRLLEWVRVNPAQVKVLPCTVDPRFRPGPKPEFLLDRYGARGKKIILTVSRLAAVERYKGHDRVIRVLPQVLTKEPDTIYLIVGDGDDRLRLEALAVQCGVKKNVTFVGMVSDEELPDHYRLADVFVMPSTGEGFGIVFLEAMASGVRAIGGNMDGSVDPLGDGALGFVIDPENCQQLGCAISGALHAPFDKTAAAERFSMRLFKENVEALVRSIHLASI